MATRRGSAFSSFTPAMVLIMMPPVSVCHQVSTIGQRSLPTWILYQFHASSLIGSPTLPITFRLSSE